MLVINSKKYYTLGMSEINDTHSIPGYVSIKDAAKMLGLSPNTVYEYVTEGRLSSVRAAHVIMIPTDEVKSFRPSIAGRPRKRLPIWRISPKDNTLFMTSIDVRLQPGRYELFLQRLEHLRQEGDHLFPGTVARYISGDDVIPKRIEIVLIWRISVMPDETEREQALEKFRQALADVLDWNTARYKHGRVFMHA